MVEIFYHHLCHAWCIDLILYLCIQDHRHPSCAWRISMLWRNAYNIQSFVFTLYNNFLAKAFELKKNGEKNQRLNGMCGLQFASVDVFSFVQARLRRIHHQRKHFLLWDERIFYGWSSIHRHPSCARRPARLIIHALHSFYAAILKYNNKINTYACPAIDSIEKLEHWPVPVLFIMLVLELNFVIGRGAGGRQDKRRKEKVARPPYWFLLLNELSRFVLCVKITVCGP